MPAFEVLKRQPNFPNEDLRDENIAMVEYFIQQENERAQAERLQESLRMVHVTAHEALRLCGVEVEYSQKEYEAFCAGFAVFERMSLIVNPRVVSGAVAVKNTQELFVNQGNLVEVGMAERREAWINVFPNVYGLVVDSGARQGDSMEQLHNRAIGAQIACELEMAA